MQSQVPLHEPVMVEEVVDLLAPTPAQTILDATLGLGGHSEPILRRGARVIGLDQDPHALAWARDRLAPFSNQLVLLHGNFRKLRDLLAQAGILEVDGALFDLGLSSLQLSQPERGFSFLFPGPLDMRMDPQGPTTAAELVNGLAEQELARLLWTYGEERYARRIARRIVENRPIDTTEKLARLVASCYPPGRHRLHPATRTFQALRIAVNDELGALEEALPQAVSVLRAGGTLVVISFHSLEDRLTKRFFREQGRAGRLQVLTKKPLQPSPEEVGRNPRARSAKLRAARVLEVPHPTPTCP